MSDEYLTHEEMLEIAAQREAMDAQKRKIEKHFDAWFEQMEGYSFRYERFWDDFDYAKESKDSKSMVKWLRSAFQVGYEQGQRLYGGTD
jgi:hypothetical protein